jgi:hypothetical protein
MVPITFFKITYPPLWAQIVSAPGGKAIRIALHIKESNGVESLPFLIIHVTVKCHNLIRRNRYIPIGEKIMDPHCLCIVLQLEKTVHHHRVSAGIVQMNLQILVRQITALEGKYLLRAGVHDNSGVNHFISVY